MQRRILEDATSAGRDKIEYSVSLALWSEYLYLVQLSKWVINRSNSINQSRQCSDFQGHVLIAILMYSYYVDKHKTVHQYGGISELNEFHRTLAELNITIYKVRRIK